MEELRGFERRVTLQSLDRHWMQHLSSMDYLKEGIGWRGYSGIDPKVLYKKEAYDMFQEMQASIQEEVVRVVSFVQIRVEGEPPPQMRRPRPSAPVHPLLAQGADEDNVGEPGPVEPLAAVGGSRAERRRAMRARGRRI